MMRLLVLCLLAIQAVKSETLLQEVNCDTNLTFGHQLVPETDAVLNHDFFQIPVVFQLTSTTLQENVYLDILTDTVQVSATNADGVAVGKTYNYSTLEFAIARKVGTQPECISTPGCDGFTLDTLKFRRAFPVTAVSFSLATKVQWSKNETTVLGRRLLANTPDDAVVIGESDLVTVQFKLAPIWSTAAFTSPDIDTTFIAVISTFGGLAALLVIVAVIYMFYHGKTKDGEYSGKPLAYTSGSYYGKYDTMPDYSYGNEYHGNGLRRSH